jgi:hypothetical protein
VQRVADVRIATVVVALALSKNRAEASARQDYSKDEEKRATRTDHVVNVPAAEASHRRIQRFCSV